MGCRQSNQDPNWCGGQALVPIPNCLRTRLVWAIGEAERLKGSAPYVPEIIVVFQANYTRWI